MCSLEAKALEVSPEAIGALLEGFGVSGVQAHDLVGTSEEEAKNLPGSLLGLLLTLPKKVVDTGAGQPDDRTKGKFVIKQAGKNMCATIAMIHVIANKMESAVPSTSALEDDNGSFLASAKEAEPEVKGDLLSHNTDLLLAHNKSAERGQSKQVDEAAHHTIAIIQDGDSVFVLDGLMGATTKVETANVLSGAQVLMSGIKEGHASLLALVNV